MKKIIISLIVLLLLAGSAYAENETKIDYKNLGIEELKKIADKGDSEAQNQLGLIYIKTETQDYKQALKYFKMSANNNNPMGQWGYAKMLQNGYGVNKNIKEAIKWFQKSANQNFIEAQFDLGLLYYNGNDVKQDYKKALEYFEKAGTLGHVKSCSNVSIMYLKGEGSAQDLMKAFEWANKNPEKLLSKTVIGLSALQIGIDFYRDDNMEDAVKWLDTASDSGNVDAMAILALVYYNGIKGVAKNEDKYKTLTETAANSGGAMATLEMAHWYNMGSFGYKKDSQKAFELAMQAYNSGSPDVLLLIALETMENGGLFNGPNKAQALEYINEAKACAKSYQGNSIFALMQNEAIDDIIGAFESEIKNMPDYIVTAAQLYKEYDANEVAASNKYKGKSIQVSGTITSIDRDIFDKNSIVKLKVPGGYGLTDVWCHFKAKDDNEIAELKKGQNIIIIGTGDVFIMGSPQLKNCQIVK